MSQQKIETRLVCGFLDAGKTTYISDCIRNDYFHKYGATLILCFEQGMAEYDPQLLSARRTSVAYYEGEDDITAFCLDQIGRYQPDRIYVEMNLMRQDLRKLLPGIMDVTFVITLIEWDTFPGFFTNLRAFFGQMIPQSQQVVFRGCPSKELLAPYGQAFRLMNQKAVYLRQDPMGYHEKAFDLFLPFSLDTQQIRIGEGQYLPLWLDAAEHPEHYDGKELIFAEPLELRHASSSSADVYMAGRVVMTCCMADLQFMGLVTEPAPDFAESAGGWIYLRAKAQAAAGEYGRRMLTLRPLCVEPAQPPAALIISGFTPQDS